MPVDWTRFQREQGTAVPVWEQLANWIVREIDAGRLKPGDQLPPERDWAPLADVGYQSARHATTVLKERGVLVSRQGVGTFVAGGAGRPPE